MRCECCDRPLNDSEATAKYAEPDAKGKPRYVGMCKKCQSFMPPDIVIVTRRDLDPNERPDYPAIADPFDLGEGEGADWDEV